MNIIVSHVVHIALIQVLLGCVWPWKAAWRGLVVHCMEGFDYEQAQLSLKIPDNYQVEAFVAIGKRAPFILLSQELQQRENPSILSFV